MAPHRFGAQLKGTDVTGVRRPRGAWAASTVYLVGDEYTNAGVRYGVTVAHTSPTTFSASSTNHEVLVPAPAAAGGIGWRGAWAASTTYAAGDLLTYGGVLYAASAHTSSTTFDRTKVTALSSLGMRFTS